MSGIKHPISFLHGFFPRKCQEKLDTQMSRMKPPISFLYGFFHGKCQKKLDAKCNSSQFNCRDCKHEEDAYEIHTTKVTRVKAACQKRRSIFHCSIIETEPSKMTALISQSTRSSTSRQMQHHPGTHAV